MAIIVVDPGHGGTEEIGGSSPNNTKGPRGTLEKTLALAIGVQVKNKLASSGHDVLMTREHDVNLGLKDRAAIAKGAKANLFVSIHFNGNEDPQVQGTETWVHNDRAEASDQLATRLQTSLLSVTGHRDRGVKKANFGVLRPEYHWTSTAACLAEISFLTNGEEESRLNTPEYREKIADGIASSAVAFLALPPLSARLLYTPVDVTEAMGLVPTDEFEDGYSIIRSRR